MWGKEWPSTKMCLDIKQTNKNIKKFLKISSVEMMFKNVCGGEGRGKGQSQWVNLLLANWLQSRTLKRVSGVTREQGDQQVM